MGNTSNSMRLFVGLPLSPGAQRSLLELSRQLREQAPEARWVAGDSMHVTLFFLGSTSPEQLSEVVSSLQAIRSAPLDLTINGTGGFERAGIFFAAVQPIPELIRLAAEVKRHMIRCGFPDQESYYKPHITLARLRRGLRPLLAASKKNRPLHISFPADRFLLYRSHLGNNGSHYEKMEEFPLTAH